MRISRVRLRNIRRHRDLLLELAPGLTVVRGPNEAGKSTLQRALELALFKRPTSLDQELGTVRTWGVDAKESPQVELEFESDGLHGELVKVFGGSRGRVELRLGDEKLTDPALVDERLAGLIGIPSEKFYRSTASVRHQEIDELARDEGTLRDRLHQSMSGAGAGTKIARQKLDAAIRRYRSEGVKNPGVIRAARDEVTLLETEAADDERGLQRLAADREALTIARERRAEAEARFRENSEALAKSEHAVGLLQRQKEAEQDYVRFRRAAELRDEMVEKDAHHPSAIALPALRNGVERLRAMERTISDLRAELAAEPDLSRYDAAVPQPRWRPLAFLGVLLTLAGVAVAYVGQALGVGTVAVLGGLGLVALAVVSLFMSARMRRRALDVRAQDILREQQISRRLRGRSQLEQQLRDTERQRDEELGRLELEDLPAAEALLAAESEHVALIDRLNAEYRGLVGNGELPDDVAKLRDRAAAEAEQMRHALAGMGEIGADPARYRERYAAAVASDRVVRERAIVDEAAAQTRVEHNDVDAESVAALAERLASAREQLAEHERRLRIYQETLAALDQAEQATMKRAARFLEQRMGADVMRITDGRYRRVKVDENELRFRVWSPERTDWVDVADLSQGTLDQFYLAARLGLVRQVTRERKPPLLFDDPFVTFDDDRARRSVQLLKELAADHQVIYLTCSTRYDDVADRIIALPAPTASDRDSAADSPAAA